VYAASTIFLAMPSSFSDKVEKLISILRVLVPWWLPEQLPHRNDPGHYEIGKYLSRIGTVPFLYGAEPKGI